MLDRRNLLILLAATAFSRAATAHDMASMTGMASVESLPAAPKVTPFAPARHAALDRLVDLVIPKSETPGAREAGVTSFIELLHEHWMTADEQRRCDAELAEVMAAFAKGGDPVINLYRDGRFRAPTLRKLTIYGYYTSEIGASEELDLNLIPGSYDACSPVARDEHAPSLYVYGIPLSLAQQPTA